MTQLVVNLLYHLLWSFIIHRDNSIHTSYEDLDGQHNVVEMQVQMSSLDKGSALLGHVPRRLVRQASIMETPLDSSGSMKMTYWF